MAKKQCIICGNSFGWLDVEKLSDKSPLCNKCKAKIVQNNEVNRSVAMIIGGYLTAETAKLLYDNKDLTIYDVVTDPKKVKVLDVFRNEMEKEMLKRKKEERRTDQSIQNIKEVFTDDPYYSEKISGVVFNDHTGNISLGAGNAIMNFGDDNAPLKYPYSSLVKYEYREGETAIATGGVGIGRALVGGALFGSAGAVVGAMTKKRGQETVLSDVSVYLTFCLDGNYYIKKISMTGVFGSKIKYGSPEHSKAYNKAQQLITKLDEIYSKCHPNEIQKPNKPVEENLVTGISSADEIRKYKVLLDEGIITEEEFVSKKKQLLGL